MNARLVSRAADLIFRSMKTKQTAAGIAADLDAAGLLQSPETAAEVERLRARVAELEQQAITVRTLHVKYTDSEHCKQDDEQWPCLTLCALGDAAPASRWQRLADALNALAGIPELARDFRAAAVLTPHPGEYRSPWRSWLAWQVTIFMGTQSTLYYVVLTWWPTVEHGQGFSVATAGLHQGPPHPARRAGHGRSRHGDGPGRDPVASRGGAAAA